MGTRGLIWALGIKTKIEDAFGGVMKLVALTLMLAFSILVLAIGMPPLEPTREETRFAQAYCQAEQIKVGALPIDTLDPWGTPFRIIRDARSEIARVVSLGPNQSTEANGSDIDDVGTGMSSPPHRTMMLNNQRRLLTSLILSASPWLVSLAVLFLSAVWRSRPTTSQVSSSHQAGTTT